MLSINSNVLDLAVSRMTKVGSKNKQGELDRFSIGFSENAEDVILLEILNRAVAKHKRGTEVKSMAWEFIKVNYPHIIEEIKQDLGFYQSKNDYSSLGSDVNINSQDTQNTKTETTSTTEEAPQELSSDFEPVETSTIITKEVEKPNKEPVNKPKEEAIEIIGTDTKKEISTEDNKSETERKRKLRVLEERLQNQLKK